MAAFLWNMKSHIDISTWIWLIFHWYILLTRKWCRKSLACKCTCHITRTIKFSGKTGMNPQHIECTPLDTALDPCKAAGTGSSTLWLPLCIGGQTRSIRRQDSDDGVHDDALIVHCVSERPDMSLTAGKLTLYAHKVSWGANKCKDPLTFTVDRLHHF